MNGSVDFRDVTVYDEVAATVTEDSSASGTSCRATFKKFIGASVADAEKLFGDADVVGAEEFIVAKGVIDGVVEDPDVGEFRRRSVGGNRFQLLSKVLNRFREVLPIVGVDFHAGRRDGADFVGKIVGGAVGEKRERGKED